MYCAGEVQFYAVQKYICDKCPYVVQLILLQIFVTRLARMIQNTISSVYIGLIMLLYLQLMLVGVPLFFLVERNTIARFFPTSSMVSIMGMMLVIEYLAPS